MPSQGSASDQQQGTLPAASLSWELTHPALSGRLPHASDSDLAGSRKQVLLRARSRVSVDARAPSDGDRRQRGHRREVSDAEPADREPELRVLAVRPPADAWAGRVRPRRSPGPSIPRIDEHGDRDVSAGVERNVLRLLELVRRRSADPLHRGQCSRDVHRNLCARRGRRTTAPPCSRTPRSPTGAWARPRERRPPIPAATAARARTWPHRPLNQPGALVGDTNRRSPSTARAST